MTVMPPQVEKRPEDVEKTAAFIPWLSSIRARRAADKCALGPDETES